MADEGDENENAFLMDSDSSHEDQPPPQQTTKDLSEDDDDSDFDPIGFGIEQRIREAQPLDDDDEDTEEEDELDEEELEDNLMLNGYMADSFKDLHVGTEIEELFRYIEDYKILHLDLETRFKPFTLDFIPAVGDIDAFIKVPRPDKKEEQLGKRLLDEPAAQQSDPSVLDLQLRALSRLTTSKELTVKKVIHGPQVIDRWIRDISDLHQSKPPPTVVYNRPMPGMPHFDV